ncbi:MAG: DUF1553 domain-containing protein [Gemmataceae bacterium]
MIRRSLAVTLLVASAAVAGPPDFDRDVRPILQQHCAKCHGPTKPKAGLRLDTLIAAGHIGSEIVRRVRSDDPAERMPPEGERLTDAQIAMLTAWVSAGPTHWSFRSIRRPPIPHVAADARHPIDRFLLAALDAKQLKPVGEADRRTLARRLHLDLIGLPPTPAAVEAFVADPDPAAYERLVERLLASPQHGERYARHWLDVVRFAETNGFETNTDRPNAWPYRDYVIRSFNADTPFDRFVTEQLAGDVLGTDEATGFLTGGPWDEVKSPDPVLTATQRADELHDMVATTGTALLGLTVGCGRCHGHKFDPIPQADYYALKAVFAGVQHGDRPLRRPETADKLVKAEALRGELRQVDRALDQSEPEADPSPVGPYRPRAAVTHGRTVDRFAPVTARFLRFTVRGTSGAEPCIDELEVFTAEDEPRNVARAAKLAASGTYANNPSHTLEHLTDGRYGNEYSWISNEAGGGWVRVEFAGPARIDRVVWSRDRTEPPRYKDRVATEYRIEVSDDGATWTTVATSADRLRRGAPAATAERSDLLARRTSLTKQIADLTRTPAVYAGRMTAPSATYRLHRGDPMQPREEVAPGVLTALPVAFELANAKSGVERRLALARWIVAKDNPLTARVIANRIWLWHFGEGLVSTPDDFGANGSTPSHPELLDWLAAELIDSGWSLRHLHRLIVTSAAYRRAGTMTPDGLARDAGNRLLWRFPARRLEAEAIRDSILAVAGTLDPTPGGPGFSPFEPNTNYVRVYTPKTAFGPAEFRRMVYATKVRMQPDPTFGAFDCPDAGQVAPKRGRSTTALQALNLLNSPFVTGQAAAFAERVRREAGDDAAAQVARVFRLAVQRDPAADEAERCAAAVREHGLATLCRALLNANEFLFLP